MFAAVNKQDKIIYVSYRGTVYAIDWIHNLTSVATGHLTKDVASMAID